MTRRRERTRPQWLHPDSAPLPPFLFAAICFIALAVINAWVPALRWSMPLLFLGFFGTVVFTVLRHTLRSLRKPASEAAPEPVATPERAAPLRPTSGRNTWEQAVTRFDELRDEYAAHECDPMAVLHRPALSDVSVASTARFVDAFAEAQAQRTDTWPGKPRDTTFATAVDRAVRTWHAAQDAADRIRLSGLTPDERASVERVLKLLTTARDSDSEPERLAAYARARTELDRLDRTGVVHMPHPARATIDDACRGALPPA